MEKDKGSTAWRAITKNAITERPTGGTALQAETITADFTEGVAPGYSDIAFQAIKDKKAYTQGQRPTHTGWRTISLEGCTERKRH